MYRDSQSGSRPPNILLVEDNPADVKLVREALNGRHNIHVVTDGGLALAFLRNEAPYEDMSPPDLIILDLNLPKISGRETLAVIKSDPSLRSIPVVILTTSEAEQDINSSYQLGANAYIVKPLEYERFASMIRSVEEFWLSLACLPLSDGQ